MKIAESDLAVRGLIARQARKIGAEIELSRDNLIGTVRLHGDKIQRTPLGDDPILNMEIIRKETTKPLKVARATLETFSTLRPREQDRVLANRRTIVGYPDGNVFDTKQQKSRKTSKKAA